ncbi:hypothetical protein BLA29_008466 [Euroglyphus maynei]|uniref:Uncharacterized protein n=1 Tax=Euroglyphus maynei TaxID=6958 RepID=A0A1Y3BQL3_EURMA|nr:hypothetical protein BLA29_008466 [Euroglyphus maynei]
MMATWIEYHVYSIVVVVVDAQRQLTKLYPLFLYWSNIAVSDGEHSNCHYLSILLFDLMIEYIDDVQNNNNHRYFDELPKIV